MKSKVGWIVGASAVVVFGLFFLIATTVLAPEPKLVRELEQFLTAHSFEEYKEPVEVTAADGRPAVDTFYRIEASEVDAWDVLSDFWPVTDELDGRYSTASNGVDVYRAPRGYRQIAEVEWDGPGYDNTVWPAEINVRVRRYVADR